MTSNSLQKLLHSYRDAARTERDNRYAIETMGKPAYPLELFQGVIKVSLETMKIVRGLPKLEID